MGTGVQGKSVERIRDIFLDYQYRLQNNSAGYYDTKAKALSQMEGVLNETDDSGLNSVLNSFWDSCRNYRIIQMKKVHVLLLLEKDKL